MINIFNSFMSQQNIPETKEQLIELLKGQLQKMEDEITEMQNNLEQERASRKVLTLQIEQKQKNISQLIEKQSKTLGDKVHEGLYKTLEAANKMRAEAEAGIRKFAQENTILNQNIIAKDNLMLQNKQKILMNAKKNVALQQKKIDAQRKSQNLKDRKEIAEKDLAAMNKQFERAEREEKQLRMHIENMKKLRLYLNKNFDNAIGKGKTGQSEVQGSYKLNKNSDSDNFWN